MIQRGWYSAMCAFLVEVGELGPVHIQKNVYVVVADHFADAKTKILARALQDECAYWNADQEMVQWVLVEIVTLDYLGEKIESGREIYSEPEFGDCRERYRAPFRPDLSTPDPSGV